MNFPVAKNNPADIPMKRDETEPSFCVSAVKKLEERWSQNQKNKIRKETSPTVPVLLNEVLSLATVDEGSEINCLDEKFALRNKVKFIPTNCTAVAAGSTSMKLAGQSLEDVVLRVQGSELPVR